MNICSFSSARFPAPGRGHGTHTAVCICTDQTLPAGARGHAEQEDKGGCHILELRLMFLQSQEIMGKEIATQIWQPPAQLHPLTTYHCISSLISPASWSHSAGAHTISASICGTSFCGLQTRSQLVFSASLTSILPPNSSNSIPLAAGDGCNIHRSTAQEQNPFGKQGWMSHSR